MPVEHKLESTFVFVRFLATTGDLYIYHHGQCKYREHWGQTIRAQGWVGYECYVDVRIAEIARQLMHRAISYTYQESKPRHDTLRGKGLLQAFTYLIEKNNRCGRVRREHVKYVYAVFPTCAPNAGFYSFTQLVMFNH